VDESKHEPREVGYLYIDQLTEAQKEINRLYNKHMQIYRQKHRYCPKCGSNDIRETLIGMGADPWEKDYKNTNYARCACKWNGTVHDLDDIHYDKFDDMPSFWDNGDFYK